MLIDSQQRNLHLRSRMVDALRTLDDNAVTDRLNRIVAYAPLKISDELWRALDAEAVRVDAIWRRKVRKQ
jgi:hypothetical protein